MSALLNEAGFLDRENQFPVSSRLLFSGAQCSGRRYQMASKSIAPKAYFPNAGVSNKEYHAARDVGLIALLLIISLESCAD